MSHAATRRALCATLTMILSTVAATAWGQAQVTRQTLDRVDTFNATAVLEMAFNVAAEDRTRDFESLGIAAAKISTCKLTASSGLYCLDGKLVRNWPDTRVPATSTTVLSCDDSALALDPKKLCTGMTVDLSGAIWLAGKSRGGSYSLIKVVARDATAAACPAGWAALTSASPSTPYCAKPYYTGRPRLGDLEVIDGDAGAAFIPCAGCAAQSGILGLEERPEDRDDDDKGNAAVFFPFPEGASVATPIAITDRRTLGCGGDELLHSVTLLQLANGATVDNYVLATTSKGRVIARNTVTGATRAVFDIVAKRRPIPPATTLQACTVSGQRQQYGIGASSKSGTVYVTDRNYCQVLALLPDTAGFGALINAVDARGNLSLSTKDATGTFPPDGTTLAPGIHVELKDCAGGYDPVTGQPLGCPLLRGADGNPIASLVGVQLADGSSSGMTLLQIKGIPDCRYAAKASPAWPQALLDQCSKPGVLVDAYPAAPGAAGVPAAQRLNVTPLLPKEVTALYARNGGTPLPPLLISPEYRGQQRNNYQFEAFFALTDAGVQFRNTFIGEYDVPLLEGSGNSLGCRPLDVNGVAIEPPSTATPDPRRLLTWDVISKVSEKVVTVEGQYVDALVNVDCRNPTKTSGDRMSLVPYDLEITPDTWGTTYSSPTAAKLTVGNDAVFARLVQSLYADLGEIIGLACPLYPGSCPVATTTTYTSSSTSASSLPAKYKSVKSRLDKCVAAAFRSRREALDDDHDDDDYCVQFRSQLAALRALVPDSVAADTANRAGELRARIDVINHVFVTRFLPSIPVNGFCREKATTTVTSTSRSGTTTTTCGYPWIYPLEGR